MFVTLVVRLVPEGLASDKFVGRVEDAAAVTTRSSSKWMVEKQGAKK